MKPSGAMFWMTISRRRPSLAGLAKHEAHLLVEILKKMSDNTASKVAFLEHICKIYHPVSSNESPELSEEVTLRCSSTKETIIVSPLSFLLLEVVEGAFETAVMHVERIHIDDLAETFVLGSRWLSSVSARLARQHYPVQCVEVASLEVTFGTSPSAFGVDDFVTLVDDSQAVKVETLKVNESPCEGDLFKLRKTLGTKVSLSIFNPGRSARLWVRTDRDKRDLRAIWDITEDHWEMFTRTNDGRYEKTFFYKAAGDDGYEKFQELLEVKTYFQPNLAWRSPITNNHFEDKSCDCHLRNKILE